MRTQKAPKFPFYTLTDTHTQTQKHRHVVSVSICVTQTHTHSHSLYRSLARVCICGCLFMRNTPTKGHRSLAQKVTAVETVRQVGVQSFTGTTTTTTTATLKLT